jgi:hypothetical protein
LSRRAARWHRAGNTLLNMAVVKYAVSLWWRASRPNQQGRRGFA